MAENDKEIAIREHAMEFAQKVITGAEKYIHTYFKSDKNPSKQSQAESLALFGRFKQRFGKIKHHHKPEADKLIKNAQEFLQALASRELNGMDVLQHLQKIYATIELLPRGKNSQLRNFLNDNKVNDSAAAILEKITGNSHKEILNSVNLHGLPDLNTKSMSEWLEIAAKQYISPRRG